LFCQVLFFHNISVFTPGASFLFNALQQGWLARVLLTAWGKACASGTVYRELAVDLVHAMRFYIVTSYVVEVEPSE